MSYSENELITLLAFKGLSKLGSSNTLKVVELNAIIALLIKACIPFDLEYSPGTRRLASAAQLTIYITPTTTFNYSINFEAGGSLFSTIMNP